MGAHATQPTRRAMIKTGTYTGNGLDDRDIDIGIDLASKENVYIIVKSVAATEMAYHRIEYAQGDLTMRYDNAVDSADEIQGLTATGFQVGSGPGVNLDTALMRYICFWEQN